MTWAPGSSLAAEVAAQQKALLWAVEIDGASTVYTTGPVASATWTYAQLLEAIERDSGGYNPRTHALMLGELTFVLVDRDGEITDLVSTDRDGAPVASLAGRTVTLWLGARGLAQSAWESVGAFSIESVSRVGGGAYRFRCIDQFPELNDQLFKTQPEKFQTEAAEYATAPTADLYIRGKSGLNYTSEYSWLVIDDGVRQWRTGDLNITSPASGGKPYLTFGADLTTSVGPGATVLRARGLEGHPLDVIVRCLLGDFATVGTIQTDFPLDAVYGTFTTDDGLGIDATRIDTAQIKAERDTYASGLVGLAIVAEKWERAADWVVKMLSGLGWLYVRRNGKLGFRGMHLPIITSGTVTLDEDNVLDAQWDHEFAALANVANVRGDEYDRGPREILSVEDTASIAATRRSEVDIDIAWAYSDLASAAYLRAAGYRHLARYRNGAQRIVCRGHRALLTVESGDTVLVTQGDLPDTTSGESMSAAVAEVADVSPAEDGVSVELWRWGALRCAGFAADAAPDYVSATDAQRAQYCYITQDDGYMADGSVGYQWA